MQELLKIAREYFPRATLKQVDNILWHNTPYPCGTHSGDIKTDFRIACIALKAAKEGDYLLCDFCNAPAVKGKDLCISCQSAWDK